MGKICKNCGINFPFKVEIEGKKGLEEIGGRCDMVYNCDACEE